MKEGNGIGIGRKELKKSLYQSRVPYHFIGFVYKISVTVK